MRDADKKHAVTKVILTPTIEWGSAAPTESELERLHHLAHENCFIANSVTTEIEVR